MGVVVEQFDPHNEAALRAWWEMGRDATAERPGNPWPAWEQARVALPADNPEADLVLLLAIEEGRAVGSAMVLLNTRQNVHVASVSVHVPPARRREGIGTALATDGEAVAGGSRRRTLTAEAYAPPGGTSPGARFAASRGFSVASRETVRELALGDYVSRREDVVGEVGVVGKVGDVADGYRIVTFDTVCPEEHLASFGRLLGMLMSEIPLGDLDLADAEWAPERLRASERRRVEIGRHVLTALAIAPDGAVAGTSDVRVNDGDTSSGQVGVTLVDPAHRGRRLGLALKVATHDLLRATYPECISVDTMNAEVNTHMNAVNERLGYRPIETLLELQKRL